WQLGTGNWELSHWQLDGNTEPRVEILGMHGAAMFLNRFACNGKAQAGSGGFGGEIRIKNAGKDLLWNARSVVLDRYDHFRVDRVATQSHDAARRGLKRILDQVGDGAPQHPRIAGELMRRRRLDLRTKVDAALTAVGIAG